MAKIENKKQTANCEHDYRIRGMDRVRSGMRVTLKCETLPATWTSECRRQVVGKEPGYRKLDRHGNCPGVIPCW